MQSLVVIGGGAALGASARWGLGLWLNPLCQGFAFGTLIANYLGSLMIGMLLALCWQFPQIGTEWRLFLITGFLGSLTTFSSFSAEVVENLFQQKWAIGMGLISAHVLGCLIFTALGIFLVRWLLH